MSLERRGPKSSAAKVQSKNDFEADTLKETGKRNSVLVIQQGSQLHQLANHLDTISNPGTHNNAAPPEFLCTRPFFERSEIFIEMATLAIFIYTWFHFIDEYEKQPSRVSVNFDIDSSFDTINKEYFALLLLGDTIFYLLMSILQLLTHKFKYVQEVNKNNAESIFRYTRYFILSYKITTITVLLYLTIAMFKIVSNQWAPQTLYLSSLFAILYIGFGWLYYNRLNQVANNPFY